MKRALPALLLVAVVVGCLGLSSTACASPSAPSPSASSRRVILVLAPYLTWADVTTTSTPTLWRLAGTGAVGDLNTRSRTREPGGEPPSPLEGALTISSGAWAQPDYSARAAFDATETVDSGTAASEYVRAFRRPMGANAIAYLGFPAAARINLQQSTGALPGTLGQAIVDAGGSTAAVGNSDSGSSPSAAKRLRPAAVAAADDRGLVAAGDISTSLLATSPLAPFGIATDLAAMRRALAKAVAWPTARGGPSLIVVDPGDPYRVRRYAPQATADTAASQKRAALRELDRVVEIADTMRGSDGILIVASQALAYDEAGALQGFGPVIVSGQGWSGYLTSASTHRRGIVTNPDITASVLSMLGIERPVEVVGDPFGTTAAPSTTETRVDWLASLSDTPVAIDSAKPGVVDAFIGGVVLLLALSALFIARGSRWAPRTLIPSSRILALAVLFALSVPVSCWLMFAILPRPTSAAAAVLVLLAVAATVCLVGALLGRLPRLRLPVIFLVVGTAVVLLADQLTGAHLSLVNFFGYSPLLGARYYGIGNEAAGIVVGSSLVGAGLVLDEWRRMSWVQIAARYGVPLLGLIVIVGTAAPFLGANVGVAIWGLFGYLVFWALANGYRMGWKTVVVALLLAVLVIGAFAVFDLFSGGQQTHLGRAVTSAELGGTGQLWAIAFRKVQTNVRVFGSTNWSWALGASLAFLAFLHFRPQREFAEMLEDGPCLRAAVIACLVAGVAAFLSEDSGIVVPAFIVMWPALTVAWLLLVRVARAAAPHPTGESLEGVQG